MAAGDDAGGQTADARCGDLARAIEAYVETAMRLPSDHPIAARVAPLVAEARKAFAGSPGQPAP